MFYRTAALENLKNTDLTTMEAFSNITNEGTKHHAAFNDYHDAKYLNNETYQPIKSISPQKFVLMEYCYIFAYVKNLQSGNV